MPSSARVCYATTDGHTEKVAREIGKTLRESGWNVTLRDCSAGGGVGLAAFDLVILGGSIHVGRHQRSLRSFIRKHRGALGNMRSAFSQ